MAQPYHDLSDETVVTLAQSGDRHAERYLLLKYRPLVYKRTQAYFLSGADREDLLQEGMIGLHKAIRQFQPDKGMVFQRFATMCVVRHVITAVRMATRQKHMPLSAYMTLNGTDEVDAPLELLDAGMTTDPSEELMRRDGLDWLKVMLKNHLSTFEREVLALYLNGKSYREMSAVLSKNTKAIDNALARIREKGRVLQLNLAFS